jgi:hypothetical protein
MMTISKTVDVDFLEWISWLGVVVLVCVCVCVWVWVWVGDAGVAAAVEVRRLPGTL